MLKIGIIGAGTISVSHLGAYKLNPDCKVVAIADLNLELAQKRADEFDIEKVYTDYKELLADKGIDAVSIVTPTFTHKDIVIDALKSGKNVLCEKPPALNADDVRKCAETAKETGKLLMYAFVCRFKENSKYLKNYIDCNKMGQFIYAEAVRSGRCSKTGGWFRDKTKAGGALLDGTIHELDLVLYLMGYPKAKSVMGYTSYVNSDLPDKIKSTKNTYISMDKKDYPRTTESLATASILLDNGAYIHLKSSSALNTVVTGTYIDICGKNAGARMETFGDLKIIEVTDDYYFNEAKPLIENSNPFEEQINHFAECCINNTECICKPEQAITLLEIIDAIYKSAETGKAIEF